MFTGCVHAHMPCLCARPSRPPKGSVSFQLGGVPAPSPADQAVGCQNRAPQIPISAQTDPSLEALQSLPQSDDRRCGDRPWVGGASASSLAFPKPAD